MSICVKIYEQIREYIYFQISHSYRLRPARLLVVRVLDHGGLPLHYSHHSLGFTDNSTSTEKRKQGLTCMMNTFNLEGQACSYGKPSRVPSPSWHVCTTPTIYAPYKSWCIIVSCHGIASAYKMPCQCLHCVPGTTKQNIFRSTYLSHSPSLLHTNRGS